MYFHDCTLFTISFVFVFILPYRKFDIIRLLVIFLLIVRRVFFVPIRCRTFCRIHICLFYTTPSIVLQ